MSLLVDLMPKGTHVVVSDPERVRARAHDLVATSQEFLEASWAAAAGGGRAPIDLGAAAYLTLADVRRHAFGNHLSWWSLSPFTTAPGETVELRDSLADRLGPGAAAYLPLAAVRRHAFGNHLSWWSLSPFTTAPGETVELRDSLGE